MPSKIIDGIEYCLEVPTDNEDDTNKPSSSNTEPNTEGEVANHCKQEPTF